MSTRKPALVTNHWTIMKLKDVRHISSLPTFNLPGGQQVVISERQKGVPSDEGNLANTNGGGCPTAAAAGSYSFYPGTVQWHHASSKTTLQPRSQSPSRRTQTTSVYSDHARQGFRYWYEDDRRPKTTKFGRYGIGTYKTMFGLGSAPRT